MEGERVPTCPLVSQVGSRTQLGAVRALGSEGLTNVSGVTGAPEGGERKEDPWGPQEAAAAAVRVQRSPELPRPLAKKPGRPHTWDRGDSSPSEVCSQLSARPQ